MTGILVRGRRLVIRYAYWYLGTMVTVERVQTGVRLETRLVKVLKGLAEYLDVSLGELLEGIVLHSLDQKVPFNAPTRKAIEQLRAVYGLDLRAADSHHLVDREDAGSDAPGRIVVNGIVRVPLPPVEAFELFTPSGETAWTKGWSPMFPAPVEDETSVGAVFETDDGKGRTTWVVAACDPGKRITYARITAGDRAGTVTVDCRDAGGGATEAQVTYALTALRAEARPELATFAAHYDGFLRHWEQAIAETLKHRER
jgi:hypothetical protein